MSRSIAMARCTPEFLAALQRRYEESDEVMESIADEFGIAVRTFGKLAQTHGWRKRRERLPRMLIPLPDTHEDSQAAAYGDGAPQERPHDEPVPDAALAHPPAQDASDQAHFAAAPAMDGAVGRTAIERMEALLMMDIEAAERARANPSLRPRSPAAAVHNARTLAILLHTLERLQRLRGGASEQRVLDDDDMPADIDEFRRELAQRIKALFDGQAGGDGAAADRPEDVAQT
jgi:hypothetical protein